MNDSRFDSVSAYEVVVDMILTVSNRCTRIAVWLAIVCLSCRKYKSSGEHDSYGFKNDY